VSRFRYNDIPDKRLTFNRSFSLPAKRPPKNTVREVNSQEAKAIVLGSQDKSLSAIWQCARASHEIRIRLKGVTLPYLDNVIYSVLSCRFA